MHVKMSDSRVQKSETTHEKLFAFVLKVRCFFSLQLIIFPVPSEAAQQPLHCKSQHFQEKSSGTFRYKVVERHSVISLNKGDLVSQNKDTWKQHENCTSPANNIE